MQSNRTKGIKRRREFDSSDDGPYKRRYFGNTGSFPASQTKNLANKRLENIRKSLEEKRDEMEKIVSERMKSNSVSETVSSPSVMSTSTSTNTIEFQVNNTNIKVKRSVPEVRKSLSDRLNAARNESNANSNCNKDEDSLPSCSNEHKRKLEIEELRKSSPTLRNAICITRSPVGTRIVKFSAIQNRLQLYKTPTDQIKLSPTIKTLILHEQSNENNLDTESSTEEVVKANTYLNTDNNDNDDIMDWDDIDEIIVLNNINEIRKEIIYDKDSISDILHYSDPIPSCSNGVFIVVDTNIFLSQLQLLKNISNKEFEAFGRATIVVPWMVFQELDYLKESKTSSLKKNSSKAISYINERLSKRDTYFKGQTIIEAANQESTSNSADDVILHCCLQLNADKKYVILLTNDTNLRNKALVHNISAFHSNDLIENLETLKSSDFVNQTGKMQMEKVKILLSNLLTHIISSEMRKAYDNLWSRMCSLQPPFTLEESLELIKKYWFSVFSMSLQKQTLMNIENFLILLKNNMTPPNITQTTLDNFIASSLTLCIYLKNGYPCYKLLIKQCITDIQSCVT